MKVFQSREATNESLRLTIEGRNDDFVRQERHIPSFGKSREKIAQVVKFKRRTIRHTILILEGRGEETTNQTLERFAILA